MALSPGELLTHQRCRPATGCGPKGCGKPIAYRTTRLGAEIPLDPMPTKDGCVALIGEEGKEIAEILSPDRLDAFEGHLYETHFETCMDGAAHRDKRSPRATVPRERPASPMLNEAQKQREDNIKAHVAALYWEIDEKGIGSDIEAIRSLFSERQKGMFRGEPDPRIRTECRNRVRVGLRERLGMPWPGVAEVA